MTFRIPQQGKFSQPNRGDLAGNINRTVGVDFKTNPGRLRLSPRLKLNTKDNDTDISNMGVPRAFAHSAGKFFAMCGKTTGFSDGTGKILVSASDSPSSTFANDALSNTPTDVHGEFSDMIQWTYGRYASGDIGDSLLVSTYSSNASQIKQLYSNTTWHTSWFTSTVSGSFVTAGGPKNMWVGPTNNLHITDDYRILTVPYTQTNNQPSALMPTADSGGNPVANAVNGTINFLKRYRPIWGMSNSDRNWISLMTYDSGKASKGYIAEWDGTLTAPNRYYEVDAPCAVAGCILDNVPHIFDAYGRLKRLNNTYFVEIARLPVANQNIEMPGIYNDNTNIRWIGHRGASVVDGKIRVEVNNYVSSGVYVEDMPSGIWEYDPTRPELGLYHVNSPCADTTDFGQQLLPSDGAGALFGTKTSTATYLAGFSYYTDSGSTSRNGIFYDDIATNTNKHAIITYPFLETDGYKDSFTDFGLRYSQMASTDSIKRKFRNYKKANLPFITSATWTASDTLTSTDDGNQQYASVGDEVEVVMGVGASSTAHITSISANAGTYTIVLDDTIGQSSGSCKIKVNNYQSLQTANTVGSTEEKVSIVGVTGESVTKLQPKIEIRASGDFELDDLTIISTKDQ